MIRNPYTGFLLVYVAVEQDQPLHGADVDQYFRFGDGEPDLLRRLLDLEGSPWGEVGPTGHWWFGSSFGEAWNFAPAPDQFNNAGRTTSRSYFTIDQARQHATEVAGKIQEAQRAGVRPASVAA